MAPTDLSNKVRLFIKGIRTGSHRYFHVEMNNGTVYGIMISRQDNNTCDGRSDDETISGLLLNAVDVKLIF